MSLESMTSEHSVTIKRLSTTQDAVGGPVETYATANRPAGSPTTWDCRACRAQQKEKIDNGISADRIGWKFLGTTDPEITKEDRLEFTYQGSSKVVKVTSDSIPLHVDGRLWRCYGEEDKTEQ